MNKIEDEIKLSLQKIVSTGATASVTSPFSYQDPTILDRSEELSDLQELSNKIDLCLKMQKKVHFVTKEIADIIKRQA